MKKLIICLFMLIGLPVFALQATINMPNSECLDEGEVLIKDVSNVSPKTDTVSTAPNLTYGIGHKAEVSIGVPVIVNYENSNIVLKSAIEAKKVINILNDNNRITVGAGIFPYLNKSVSPEAFLYAHATRKINKTGTFLSIGGYAQGDKTLVNSGGLLMILDQKVYKDLHLVSEYTTGNGSRSNYSAGLKYKIKGISMTGAVILPNHSNNVGFQIILSKKFGGKR